ncbi:NUDIX domain-containing protein [Lederbergia citrea]|uniref:NUDIX hydrolase n=2 Tax=Lederbergia citrea TaxID=2833581 RepID=A0A942UTM6_9BACI|nr:NUDIX hydrolase [Lederbergia citrea]MBS4179545.1 NUDIX hydrolase [Lederbergia citrea]MBS4206213.1 NUDIX hydrolase [Lederbergia citrea]MBS4224853.1 NUDIX hydrolase [Lederbergia citrea]
MSCGHLLEIRDIDGTERLACMSCSFVHWGNYSVGVGAIVIKDNKVLLVRRAQEPGKGKWTNPGGYIEQNEFIEDTIVRELMEETGIKARVTGITAIRDQPSNIHNIYLVFAMEYLDGEARPDEIEVDAAGFFSMEEMRTLDVADLTKWIVDSAMNATEAGLIPDKSPIIPLNGNGLFRVAITGE